MKMVKVSFEMPEEMFRDLKELARGQGITVTETLRRAIRTSKFFRDEQAKGNRVLIRDERRREDREVLLP